jgi:prefoldin subunit 5
MVETKDIKKDEPCVNCSPPTDAQQPAPPVQKDISIQEAIDSINRELTALKGILEELKNPQKPVDTQQPGSPADQPAPNPNEPPVPGAPVPPDQQYPLPKKSETMMEASTTVEEDMVNLAEYTNYIENYLKANKGKTAMDAAIEWKSKKVIPATKPPKQKPVPPTPPTDTPPADTPPTEAPSNYPYPAKKDFDELKKSFDDLVGKMAQTKKLEDMEVVVKAKDDELKTLMKRIEVLEKSEVPPKTTVPTVETIEKSEDTIIEDKDGSFTKPFEGDLKLGEPRDVAVVKDLISRGVMYKDPDYQ